MSTQNPIDQIHLSQGQDVEIEQIESNAPIRVGVSWDFTEGTNPVDLDVAAIGFDSFGMILDAAYFNALDVFDGAIKHSGDVQDGKKEGYDECIDINISRLPSLVSAIAIVINAHKGGSFFHVESASATISYMKNGEPTFLADASLGCGGQNTGLLLAGMNESNTCPIFFPNINCCGHFLSQFSSAIRAANG